MAGQSAQQMTTKNKEVKQNIYVAEGSKGAIALLSCTRHMSIEASIPREFLDKDGVHFDAGPPLIME